MKSLKTLLINYQTLLEFFATAAEPDKSESVAMVKAGGFLDRLKRSQFYFLLVALVKIFERLEVLNKELQAINMDITESYEKIMVITESLKQLRNSGFENTWSEAIDGAERLELEDPKTPRVKKIP